MTGSPEQRAVLAERLASSEKDRVAGLRVPARVGAWLDGRPGTILSATLARLRGRYRQLRAGLRLPI